MESTKSKVPAPHRPRASSGNDSSVGLNTYGVKPGTRDVWSSTFNAERCIERAIAVVPGQHARRLKDVAPSKASGYHDLSIGLNCYCGSLLVAAEIGDHFACNAKSGVQGPVAVVT